MRTVKTEIPEKLYEKAEVLVKQGWFRNEKDFFSEAIGRFFETHQSDLVETEQEVSQG
jgi:hypothetical protein